jgi:hypothetical protein
LFGYGKNELQEAKGNGYGSDVSHKEDQLPVEPNCKEWYFPFEKENLIVGMHNSEIVCDNVIKI